MEPGSVGAFIIWIIAAVVMSSISGVVVCSQGPTIVYFLVGLSAFSFTIAAIANYMQVYQLLKEKEESNNDIR